MTTYQIAEVKDDYVYCVVTRDNGETFGQMVYGADSKTEEGIAKAVAEALGRIEAQETPRDAKILEAANSGAVKELVR